MRFACRSAGVPCPLVLSNSLGAALAFLFSGLDGRSLLALASTKSLPRPADLSLRWLVDKAGRLTAALALLAIGLGRSASGGGVDEARPGSLPDFGGEMVLVPEGEFLMGSDAPEADKDERPVARVFLETFWIDRVEVTNGRYRPCVDAGACAPPIGPGFDQASKTEYPVTIVSWSQADAYCRWVGKRLPTEAEWEKAARGVDGRIYPWGSRFESGRANVGYTAGTDAVGSYPTGSSPYGVLDMAGNVFEWTSSLYKPYPYRRDDGREDPKARGARVNRGGSWYYGAWYARATYRATANHIYRRISDLGFRCASSEAPK
jgi:formylglycine-generating enzyme required for sulfatase activity